MANDLKKFLEVSSIFCCVNASRSKIPYGLEIFLLFKMLNEGLNFKFRKPYFDEGIHAEIVNWNP